MAVIVRETRILAGREHKDVAVFKSNRPVGAAERKQAERLDQELKRQMRSLVNEVRREGWLNLKGRPGVVRLWWEVGRRLRTFVDELDAGCEEDRLFIWEAMYNHAPELVPGKIGVRASRPLNSHFYYCYQLGRFEWPAVEAFGDWTSWVEFFDSERIRNDERIAEWLGERAANPPSTEWKSFMSGTRMDWFRPLAKAIRHAFARRDTCGLERDELYKELDDIFASVVATDQNGCVTAD